VLLLCLVITTRPAYVGLALLPLALGGVSWRARLAGGAGDSWNGAGHGPR
jgi:hypothetical protein